MKTFLGLIAITFLLTGCISDGGGSDAGMCRTACDACAQGTECVALSSAFFGPQYHAACLKPCTSSSDCLPTEHCHINGTLLAPVSGPRYCVGPDGPPRCNTFLSGSCTEPTTTECLDDHTLARGYLDGDLCGFEAVRCASRCVPATAQDAGPDGGMVQASCE